MKVVREICPKCKRETQTRTDMKDVHSYTEEIVHKRCSKCAKLKLTPEEQLLDALFGGGKT